MRLATWNVNSIRARMDRLLAWLERSDVDILAIQETKIPDAGFPEEQLAELGYQAAHHGFSQWNGVAILSRVGLDDVQIGLPAPFTLPTFADATEARAIGATCGGVQVWSVYVPNGRAVGDPHYAYKLAWLDALRGYAAATSGQSLAVCGDFNIAPTDDDVWSVEYYRTQTHTTPPERAAFVALLDAGLQDVVRPYTPGPGVYTYWDYTQLSFPKRRGMRIDFVLASEPLATRVTGAVIDREERKGKLPSDHAPVIVEWAM